MTTNIFSIRPLVVILLFSIVFSGCGGDASDTKSNKEKRGGGAAAKTEDEKTSGSSVKAGTTEEDVPKTTSDQRQQTSKDPAKASRLAPYPTLEEELVAAANTWLAVNAKNPYRKTDKVDSLPGVATSTTYGTDGSREWAWAGAGITSCELDSQILFVKEPDQDWAVKGDIHCAGDIGPACEETPTAMRAVWYGPTFAESCQWGDITSPDLDSTADGLCTGVDDVGTFSIDGRTQVTCGHAIELYTNFLYSKKAGGSWQCTNDEEGVQDALAVCYSPSNSTFEAAPSKFKVIQKV